MSHLKVVFLSNWWGNPYKKLLIEHLSSKGVQVERCNFSIIFLRQVLRYGKPDILHLHVLQPFFIDGRSEVYTLIKFFVFISQLLILKLIGVKVIWTVHELNDPKLYGGGNIPPISAAILGRFLDAIITHCNTVKHEINTLFFLNKKTKAFVIPHGNYIDCYENKIDYLKAREALGIPNQSLVFLFFGSIYRYKGVVELINSFKQLQQDEVYLVIAGEPRESQLKETILDTIKEYKNILFVPESIPDDKVQFYMNGCDCVVVPYKEFTTSGVAILAMSYGRACIAPRLGFFSDVLDNSGAFLYDLTHEEGLLQAMKCAVDNKHNILNMGKHNLELAEKWNWNYVAEMTSNVYQWCLSRSKTNALSQSSGQVELESILKISSANQINKLP